MERNDYLFFLQSLVKKYGGGVQLNVPPSYFLNRFALETNTSFLEGVFTSPFSLYKRGVGKSVYCLKTLYYVYGRDVEKALKHIVFMPQHFLSLFKEAIDRNRRIRMIVWDDAGFWLGAQRWHTEFVRSIREFMNVIRTHVATIMVTAPSPGEVARGIRINLDILGLVRVYDYYFDLQKRKSILFFYDSDTWSTRQGRSYPPPIIQWIFKQYLEWYPRYEKMRKKYVKVGVRKAEESLREVSRRATLELREILSGYEPRPKDIDVEEGLDVSDTELETVVEEELGDYL